MGRADTCGHPEPRMSVTSSQTCGMARGKSPGVSSWIRTLKLRVKCVAAINVHVECFTGKPLTESHGQDSLCD